MSAVPPSPNRLTDELEGCLDLPVPGHPAGDAFRVAGWIFSRGRKIDAIHLRHLSGWSLPLTAGIERSDVGQSYPSEPQALQSGFQSDTPIPNGFGSGEYGIAVVFEGGGEHIAFTIDFGPAIGRKSSLTHPARRGARLRVLFVDDRFPDPSEGKGDGRAFELMSALLEAGHKVAHFRMIEANRAPAWNAIPENVEVLPGHGPHGLIRHLRTNAGHYDCTLVSRPPNLNFLRPHLDLLPRPLVYDSEGIWAEMHSLAAAVRGQPWSAGEIAEKTKAELEMGRDADVVLAVSPRDAAAFENAGIRSVIVASHAVDPDPGAATFADRTGLLFFGALEPGTPNADSIRWLVEHVMPRLRELAGNQTELTVIGPGADPELVALGGPDVRFIGKQAELASFANQARIFVAPTRISSGIPIKLIHAAAMGLPAVATSQLAHQLGWKDGDEVLVADTPERFADCCGRLLQDEALWQRLRARALARVNAQHSRQQFKAAVSQAFSRCRHAVRPVFLDCGTHYGEGLRDLAKIMRVDASWEVHCFEANPACWPRYDKEPLLDIPSLHVHRQAVWIKDGSVQLRQEVHAGSGERRYDGEATTVVSTNAHPLLGSPITVPCVDLGRVVQEIASRADYLVVKLDVEGAEYTILRKLLKDGTLEHVDELYVEFHARLLPEESLESTQQLKAEIATRCPRLRLVEWD